MKKKGFSFVLLVSLISFLLPIHGHAKTESRKKKNSSSIGLFTGHTSKIYKSGEVPINVLPIFSFYYNGFYLKGVSLGYEWAKIYPKPYIELTPNLLMLSPNDGNAEGLKRRNWTIMGGGGLNFYLPLRLVLNTHLKVDILGRYNSGYLNINVKRTFMFFKRLLLSPSFFIKAYEKKYVDYYFGVSESEVRPNRPVYKGKNATEYGGKLFAMFFINEKWSLQATGSYSWLSKEITRSPIVSRKTMISYYFGISKKI